MIAVDSQGYLREVRDTHVYPIDWTDKREALQYIHFLKVNEHEMEVLTGLADQMCIRDRSLILCKLGTVPIKTFPLQSSCSE